MVAKARAVAARGELRDADGLLQKCSGKLKGADGRRAAREIKAEVYRLDLESTPREDSQRRYELLAQWHLLLPAGVDLPEPYAAELRKLKEPREAASKKLWQLDHWQQCEAAGRLLRKPNGKAQDYFERILLQAVGFTEDEKEAVARRKIQIGMKDCAVYAALGRPSVADRVVGSRGETAYWHYGNGRYKLVVMTDGVVYRYVD